MSNELTASPVSALHSILDWSRTRPEWQRNALRLLRIHEQLTTEHISGLLNQCKAKHALPRDPNSDWVNEPLDEIHLPPRPGSEASVTLVSVGSLQHVNRLPSDQELTFDPLPGITVIYGENGTGKSGFARVVKKSCRTRGSLPTIRPNIFSKTISTPANAVIRFQVAGAEVQTTWTDGTNPDPRLANIFVFDTSSAITYLEEDGPLTFTPRGLDLLPKLSKLCDTISKQIQAEINELESEIASADTHLKPPPGTAVAELISGLSKATRAEQVEQLAGLSSTDANRLSEITVALDSNGKQSAKAKLASSNRIRNYSKAANDVASKLSDEACRRLESLVENATEASAIAADFKNDQFDITYMRGTGTDTWKQLWKAARDFAISGPYPDQAYPSQSRDLSCVLCQQQLNPDGIRRLSAFDSFSK